MQFQENLVILSFFLKLVGRSRSFDKKKYTTVADIMRSKLTNSDNIAIEFEDKKYTYREMDAEANQIANWQLIRVIRREM